jgi:methylglyoxal synthase
MFPLTALPEDAATVALIRAGVGKIAGIHVVINMSTA